MSEPRNRDREGAEEAPKKTTEEEDDRALDLRVTEYLKLGVPAGTIACAIAAGYAQGAAAVVLVLAGGALIAAIAIFWASVRTLVGETPLSGADAYALGAPRAEEEQKRAVLRALKDLEFEHSVGKISDEDYNSLVSKYRAEAKRLLRVLDEDAQPQRVRIEALVQKRLQLEGIGDDDEPEDANDDEVKRAEEPKAEEPAPKKAEKKAETSKAAKIACAKCGVKNDVDAVFCKKCGERQRPKDDEEDEEEESDETEREEASK